MIFEEVYLSGKSRASLHCTTVLNLNYIKYQRGVQRVHCQWVDARKGYEPIACSIFILMGAPSEVSSPYRHDQTLVIDRASVTKSSSDTSGMTLALHPVHEVIKDGVVGDNLDHFS